MNAYTQIPKLPKTKSRSRGSRRLIALLLLFFIILLMILFFNSSLSRVHTIEIQGLKHVTKEEMLNAIQVQEGDHFISVSKAAIVDRALQLKAIHTAHATKQFPGTIKLEIEEFPEVAYRIADNQKVYVILANGFEAPAGSSLMLDKPILTGWDSQDPHLVKLSEVLSEISPSHLQDVSEIKPDASMAYLDKIKIYTRSGFEVITTIQYLPEKVTYLDNIIYDLRSKNMTDGIITMLEADVHTPFQIEEELEKESSLE